MQIAKIHLSKAAAYTLLASAAITAIAVIGIASSSYAEAAEDDIDTTAKSAQTSIIRTSHPEQTRAVAKSYGLKEVGVSTLPNGEAFITVDASASHVGLQLTGWQMRHDPSLKISPNYDYKLMIEPNDPNYSDQWNLPKIDAPTGWNITTGSENVTIAVIDTGVLFTQEWGKNAFEKRHITSRSTFDSLGYSKSDVISVHDSLLPSTTGASVANDTIHPDGTLIRPSGSDRVYIIKEGRRRYIPAKSVFDSYNFTSKQAKTATSRDMELSRASNLSFREGTLLRGSEAPVYAINYTESGAVQKRHITSRAIFDSLGYSSDDVINVHDSLLPTATGSAITSDTIHPDGTLIRPSGSPRVYILENQQRRYIPSMSVFESYNFTSKQVKTATTGDMELTRVSNLPFREGALLQGSGDPVYVASSINEQSQSQPDFPAAKRWQNISETINSTDADGNGFVDDVYGWDFMGGWRGGNGICPNYDSPNTFETKYGDDFFISQDNDPQPYSCDSPSHPYELNMHHYDGSCTAWVSACFIGHGTVVASVASSATNNNQLVAGVDWNAKVMNIRVLDGYGWGDSARVAAGIEYATEMGADVINLSLAVFDNSGSCTTTDSTVESALAAAKTAGIVTVAASGNGGDSNVCYPARSPYTIAVGATKSDDTRASFSSYGPELDVVAPGVDIPAANTPAASNNYNNYHSGASGTSLATPHVAGLAGLIKALKPDYTFEQVRDAIRDGADKVPDMGIENRTDEYGYGRININSTLTSITP